MKIFYTFKPLLGGATLEILSFSLTNYSSKKSIFLTLLILILGYLNPLSPLRADRNYDNRVIDDRGIADERGFYYQGTGLLAGEKNRNQPTNLAFKWFNIGKDYKKNKQHKKVHCVYNAGFAGYFSGPEIYLIDVIGLCDPFLARAKADLDYFQKEHPTAKTGWRIGHFFRIIPDGYIQSRRFDKNLIQDKDLALLYEQLTLVTRGDIFSPARFKEIWKLNTLNQN